MQWRKFVLIEILKRMLHLSSGFSHGCLKKREKQIIDNHVSKLIHIFDKMVNQIYVWFMSFGQSIECQNWYWMSNICYCYFFNFGQVLKFGANSRYNKGALTQKRSFLVLYTTFIFDGEIFMSVEKIKTNIQH